MSAEVPEVPVTQSLSDLFANGGDFDDFETSLDQIKTGLDLAQDRFGALSTNALPSTRDIDEVSFLHAAIEMALADARRQYEALWQAARAALKAEGRAK